MYRINLILFCAFTRAEMDAVYKWKIGIQVVEKANCYKGSLQIQKEKFVPWTQLKGKKYGTLKTLLQIVSGNVFTVWVKMYTSSPSIYHSLLYHS